MVFNGGRALVPGSRRLGIGFALLAAVALLVVGPRTALAADDANLSITKTATPTQARVGDFILYRIVVTNNGPKAAKTVRLTDTLPTNVDFANVNSSSGTACMQSSASSSLVTCTLPDLAKNGTATVTILVWAAENGTAENTAEVTAANDPDDTNNDATASTRISNDSNPNNPNNPNSPFNPNNPNSPFNPNNPNSPFFNPDTNGDGVISQQEEADAAENDLNGETTDGEITDGSSTDGNGSGVSATSDGNGAEASTPGAVAQSGGDPDTQSPVSGPQGDVVDEVPTSGPLPDTGGASVAAGTTLALVAFGVCLLTLRLVVSWRGRR